MSPTIQLIKGRKMFSSNAKLLQRFKVIRKVGFCSGVQWREIEKRTVRVFIRKLLCRSWIWRERQGVREFSEVGREEESLFSSINCGWFLKSSLAVTILCF